MNPVDDDVSVASEPAPLSAGHTLQMSRSHDGQHVLLPPLELKVITGPDRGITYRASSDRVVVGVHPSADLVLHDPTISRFHCEVRLEGDRVAIRDLSSRNGTLVDGVSVVHAHLKNGSKISIGSSELELRIGRDPVRVKIAEIARFGSLVGESLPMRAAFAVLERAAKSDATVLLSGETGTGKELAAESIHAASARRDGPFVIVDCAAIPGTLLESELFGHEKGAFTGAVTARRGAFEAADGGTLFLDEIGELGFELQPKLLRVLEGKQIKRLGQPEHSSVDVRVIAATNRDLQREVNARRFRPDLYYRLAVIEVRLPPLRERLDDLPTLVQAMIEALGAAQDPAANALRGEACYAELARHPWPGNVRELRNYIERSLALAERQPLLSQAPLSEPPPSAGIGADHNLRSARESWMRDFERRYLEELLAANQGNVSAAARSAGVDRKYLYRLLWRNGLR